MSEGPDWPRFLPVGDTGLSVEFGDQISAGVSEAVVALDRAIALQDITGVVEVVPSFRSLLVVYEPAETPFEALRQRVQSLIGPDLGSNQRPIRRWIVPVVYEQPYGEDLAEAADLLGLSTADLVGAHTKADFRVYMLGFQPGLPNLGGLPDCLQLSRRASPRAPVPPRSVTIGGAQAAIMPMATPTGFYLLGRTPVRPFDRRRENPALFQPGDRIQFREIGAAEYNQLEEAADDGDLFAGATLEMA